MRSRRGIHRNSKKAISMVSHPNTSNNPSNDDGETEIPEITNVYEDGPATMGEIIESIREATSGWPRRVGDDLFVPASTPGEINWLNSPSALLGWLGSTTGKPPRFNTRRHDCHSKSEVFSELKRTAQAYRGIETLPHWPPLPNVYYSREFEPGNGQHLLELISRFSPETEVDRDLILTAFVTPGWGANGDRPCFTVTSDAATDTESGRGVGKSTLAEMVGKVWGDGHIDFTTIRDGDTDKARLLSVEAMEKRVAVIGNLKSWNFSCPWIEDLITCETISGRRNHKGEGRRPNTLVWFITVNAASFDTDIAKRGVTIKLARPAFNPTWKAETKAFINENRDAIVADAIGFLRNVPARELTGYTRWSTWEKAVLSRIQGVDPIEAQRVILERQQETDTQGGKAEELRAMIWEKLDAEHYVPSQDAVFIDSGTMASFLTEIEGRKIGRQKSSRIVKSMTGRIPELEYTTGSNSPHHRHGRGFVWRGTPEAAPIQTTLAERLNRTSTRRPGGRW